MNIIHIIGTLNTGGVQKYILQLSKSPALDKYIHQVLCTIKSSDNYKSEFEKNHIPIHRLSFSYSPKTQLPNRIDKLFRNIFSSFYFFRLWYYLIRSDTNIVHSHIHSHIISQISAIILSGKRMIWTIHGEYSLSRITIQIIRIVDFMFPNRIVQIISDSKSALIFTLPYKKRNLTIDNIIATGIDLVPFSQEYDKSSIRKKFNIKEDTILIGSTGRIVWEKGYDQLITLLQKYDFNEKKIHILIAGEGSLKNKYKQKIKKNGLDNKISFIGNIMYVPKFLNALDIYIQPSVSEGFPLSVLESMAAGLPIICSDIGGLQNMITEGENGVLYRSGDIKALYEAVNELLNSPPEKIVQLGVAARKTALNNFSIYTAAEKYLVLYNNS